MLPSMQGCKLQIMQKTFFIWVYLTLLNSLVAKDKSVKNSQSIAGNSDMTLFEIIDILITKSGS